MQRAGFDGYALDFVKCSDGMRWFLQNMGLHKTVGNFGRCASR